LSDVFASALWSADYSLLLASNNYSGINLHGGTGKSVADSVGGYLPGDILLQEKGDSPDQIASHPHPFYTPIATFSSEYVMEPVGCGLKFAGEFSGATFLQGDFTSQLQATGVNASAYVAKRPNGNIAMIVLNKDADEDLEVTVDLGARKTRTLETKMLQSSSLSSREAHIISSRRLGRLHNGKYTVPVPRSTGVCLNVR